MAGFLNFVMFLCIVSFFVLQGFIVFVDNFDKFFNSDNLLATLILIVLSILLYGSILNCMRIGNEHKRVTWMLALNL